MSRLPGLLGALLFWPATLFLAVAGVMALSFHFRPLAFALMAGPVVLLALVAAVLRGRGHEMAGWLALAALALGLGGWWLSLRPSNDRAWEVDVSRGVTAEIEGDMVTVHNVRDFDWHTPTEATPRWKTETYRLSELTSVDVFTSTWAWRQISHVLLGFGFADGRHLVFSAEVRRSEGREYSEIGGFFRMFELVLIAAEEEDIIRLRTTVRGEDVALYPLAIPMESGRRMFLDLLAEGNALARTPRFYNTLTSNCTTVLFRLARAVHPALVFDWRIVLSGFLPEYLHDNGMLQATGDIAAIREAARISARGRAAEGSGDFSVRIREAAE